MGAQRSAMAHDPDRTVVAGEAFELSDQHLRWLHILAGPALFFVSLAFPVLGPLSARFGFGILFWMIYWWVTVPIDIKVTCLVPVLVAAAYPFMPLDKVVASYADKELLLIIGMSMMTAAWARWGFARRIGLHFLSLVGNNVQAQTVAWFWLCGVVSFVVANTPVGAIFAPVAVAALLYAGYQSFEQRYKSAAASNILIAVSWGAAVGGMTTPLGGGQAVVTLAFFEKYIQHEVYFIDWTIRMLPLSLLVMTAMSIMMYYFMRPEITEFKGSKDYYRKELAQMGPMTYEEKVISIGFLLVVGLAMLKPLYAQYVKGPNFAWLSFSPLFFIVASLLFFWPARTRKGENIISIPTLVQHFPITILFIWPASVALGTILNDTGVSAVFAQWLQPFIAAGDVAAISAVTIGSNGLSQVTSDTATAGVMMPLVIKAFSHWNGLEYGAVAFIWIAGASLSFSYATASATGAQGIVAGYGANLQRMFVYGIIGGAISIVITIAYFWLTVAVLKLDFYILPPSTG
jgi:solute carrier family 13 (sodium-dependent dicarboxylate transporter), member 2/3/5